MGQQLGVTLLPSEELLFGWDDSSKKQHTKSIELEKRIFRTFQDNPYKALLELGLIKGEHFSPSVEFWKTIIAQAVKELLLLPDIERLREKVKFNLPSELLNNYLIIAPPLDGGEYLTTEYIQSIFQKCLAYFKGELKIYEGTVHSYFQELTIGDVLSDRIHFHLVENRKDEDAPFAFIATYSTITEDNNIEQHIPLRFALEEFRNDNKKLLELLSTVHKAARHNELLKDLLESGDLFQPVGLRAEEAYHLLQGVPAFEDAGILCRIPRWWSNSAKKASVSLSVGNNVKTKITLDAILDCEATLSFDGEVMSVKELQDIMDRYNGLAFIKGRWVHFDRESLEKSLAQFGEAQKYAKENRVSLSDAIQLFRDGGGNGKASNPYDSVQHGEWLASLFNKMKDPTLIKKIAVSKKVKATLREYQQVGVNWLNFLHNLQFGICLADDMGLGKTIQVLAFLQTLRAKKSSGYKTSLLIVPASLMSNWMGEIEKFTPTLKAVIAHPQWLSADKLSSLPEEIDQWDLIITTYAMAKSKKFSWITKREWFYCIIDEAQAIKNPRTAQTKAVKAIKSSHKIALTGTPIENRLQDLWSLFDFLNPGLLGGTTKFKEYVKGINQDPTGYSHLKQVISPYILRRLKTDKSIISDLPDKVEMTCYAELSKKQVVLYKGYTQKLEDTINEVEGINRRGLILEYLMKFKQLCNHPDQLIDTGNYNEKDSGKFDRLRELCTTIAEKHEKVLIFTQFKEIMPALDSLLQDIFKQKGLTLHGGTNVKKRKEMVKTFQESPYVPYFILSLKAGGVGLNLTAANHVIHFDRWWNPAVENQATDRAFRIGQKKSVMVHKFVSKGTIEEKIDAMIAEKKELSEKVIGKNSEDWISTLSNDNIINMFKLEL